MAQPTVEKLGCLEKTRADLRSKVATAYKAMRATPHHVSSVGNYVAIDAELAEMVLSVVINRLRAEHAKVTEELRAHGITPSPEHTLDGLPS